MASWPGIAVLGFRVKSGELETWHGGTLAAGGLGSHDGYKRIQHIPAPSKTP